MKYRVRTVKPRPGIWVSVEAETPEEAASEFHLHSESSYIYRNEKPDDRVEMVHLALVEVEGFGELIARSFSSGIFRRGGVRPRSLTLADIAKHLGWDDSPEELLEEGWFGEETYDEARSRKKQR